MQLYPNDSDLDIKLIILLLFIFNNLFLTIQIKARAFKIINPTFNGHPFIALEIFI